MIVSVRVPMPTPHEHLCVRRSQRLVKCHSQQFFFFLVSLLVEVEGHLTVGPVNIGWCRGVLEGNTRELNGGGLQRA